MSMRLVYLPASALDALAGLLYYNNQGTVWTPTGGKTECAVFLIDQQVRYLETRADEEDGYIENGVMWIGGTDYPLATKDDAR